jgi:hypothetical protein
LGHSLYDTGLLVYAIGGVQGLQEFTGTAFHQIGRSRGNAVFKLPAQFPETFFLFIVAFRFSQQIFVFLD